MSATKYDVVLGVTGNELEQINDEFHCFTPYSHPPLFDMDYAKRDVYKLLRYRRNKHIKVCYVCGEGTTWYALNVIEKRGWKVSRNISLERIPGDYVLEY